MAFDPYSETTSWYEKGAVRTRATSAPSRSAWYPASASENGIRARNDTTLAWLKKTDARTLVSAGPVQEKGGGSVLLVDVLVVLVTLVLEDDVLDVVVGNAPGTNPVSRIRSLRDHR